jgi:integrase
MCGEDAGCFTFEKTNGRKHVRVEIRKGRQGKLRKSWYGNYEINGKRHCINLGVEVKGTAPDSLRDFGDVVFERTRAKAQDRLETIVKEARSLKNSQHILEKIYEQKTGTSVPEVALCDLSDSWKSIPRKAKLSKKYVNSCGTIFRRFTDFIKAWDPKIFHLSEINEKIVSAFLKCEEDRGISGKTYNDVVKLLRTSWNNLLPGFPNPLRKIPGKSAATRFRMPFREEQLEKILEVAGDDDFIFPIIVVGICTAMRRGDCCLLRWKDVDMENNFISVKTAKTGAPVEIPIWELLRGVLVEAGDLWKKNNTCSNTNRHNNECYVFPEQAAMYLKNPDGITLRVKKVLSKAGISVVADCSQVEGKTDEPRLRKASDYDFHSFRVTWVTLALSRGVPMEIVQRVTGHSTVSVVTKHYFQPNREDFRRVLENKLPCALRCGGNTSTTPPSGGNTTSLIVKTLQSMDDGNWEGVRDEILKCYENKEF